MKQLELNLQKRLLIVEVEFIALGNGKEFHFENDVIEKYLKVDDVRTHKLICKGSELTEEIAETLVNGMYNNTYLTNTSIPQLFKSGLATYIGNATEAFIKQIESKGYCFGFFSSLSAYKGRFYNWEEAESKTFNPEKTLIFEIL